MMKELMLSNGQITLVDDRDFFVAVARGPWHSHSGAYARANAKGKHPAQYLHQWIVLTRGIAIPPGFHVHHKSGDRLDNRLENLEVLGQGDHNRKHPPKNRTGFRGVTAVKNGFRATLTVHNCLYNLGEFDTAAGASVARDSFLRLFTTGTF